MESRLYLLFTPSACRGAPWRTLEQALRGGVDLVQWRVKERDRDGARRCLEVCTSHGVPLIVNDDPELAVAVGAAGVHVGQDDPSVADARAVVGPDLWIGVSTHDTAQVESATAQGADYLGFGPMFPTPTKGYVQGQPPGALRAAVAHTLLPVFAIGGIDASNLCEVLSQGVDRIAVSSAILAADAPSAAASRLRERLQRRC